LIILELRVEEFEQFYHLLAIPEILRTKEQLELYRRYETLLFGVYIRNLSIIDPMKDAIYLPSNSFPKFVSLMDNLKELDLRYSMTALINFDSFLTFSRFFRASHASSFTRSIVHFSCKIIYNEHTFRSKAITTSNS
jgi:hypothetical protein